MEDPKSLHDSPPTQEPNPPPQPVTVTPPSPEQPQPPPATSSPPRAAPQPALSSSQPQAPPQSTSPSPSPPPPQEAAPPPPESKKRPRDDAVQLYQCKMRAVLKDIRPHVLEILQTVEFRKCRGAHELKEKLKLVIELYRQMIAGAGDFKNTTQHNKIFAKPSENRNLQSTVVSEMLLPDANENVGVIVGGSAFGWNFITFPGGKAVYYGRSKESFRAIQAFTEKHMVR